MSIRTGLGLLMAALLGLPALPASASFQQPSQSDGSGTTNLIARGGGGGGGSRGGGGGTRGGGGGSRGSRGGGGGGGARTGFSTAGGGGGLNRGSSRPEGGWSNNARGSRAGGGPSLERRPAMSDGANRLGTANGGARVDRSTAASNLGDRNLGNRNLTDRNLGTRNLSDRNLGNRNLTDRNLGGRNLNANINRNWNRSVNINNVNLRPGWARPGWGNARPWNYGWYGGWATPAWGWWGARAATWGIGALATAAVINNAVDNAINSEQTMIVVPNSNYQLLYGTVQPVGNSGVQFDVSADGATYQLTADCQSGLLNGEQPNSAAEAELLNAACQVAFGNS